MSREVDYDVDLFVEMVRSGTRPAHGIQRNIRGFKKRVPPPDDSIDSSTIARRRVAR